MRFDRCLILTNATARQGRIRFSAYKSLAEAVRTNPLLAESAWTEANPLDPNEVLPEVQKFVRNTGPDETLAVFAAGGDGTAHVVANAILSIQRSNLPVMGILPMGTGNDFAKMLGFKNGFDPLTQLASARVAAVDVGLCNGRYFLNDLGLGLFSEATRLYHRMPKYLRGSSRYLAAATGAIARPWNKAVTVRLGAEVVHNGAFAFAAISNGSWSGGRFRMNPQGSVTDGMLDALICSPMSRLELMRNLPRLSKGTHVENPAIIHRRGVQFEIESQDLEIYQLDGDLHEFHGRLEVQVQPAKLKVLRVD